MPLAIAFWLETMYNITMVELTNNEQLIYFMLTNLRLSRNDDRFLHNLEKFITTTKRVTSNQVSLVEKLITKYERQFVKHEIFIANLLLLPWNTRIVQTTEEYTSAHIGIVDNNIILKTPYNKLFINAFRSASKTCFVWDNTQKYYIGVLSTHSLKLAITITKKYFTAGIRYSDNVTKLLAQLEYYANVKYWTPTLVYVNGNYMIACSNQALDNALKHIELNTELTTLAELARHGVTIIDNVLITDEERFAAAYNPKIELSNISDIVPWLKNIKCDCVFVSGIGLSNEMQFKNSFKHNLKQAGIQYSASKYYAKDPSNTTSYNFPVAVRFRLIPDFFEPLRVAKVITIVNSKPINLEKNETM